MDNENITKTALDKSLKYIDARLNDINKEDSRVMSGYSAKSSKLPEITKAYAFAVQETLQTGTAITRDVMNSIREDIDNGTLDKLSTDNKANLALKIANIYKILSPTLTIKEEVNKDGTVKRTTWGQGSVSS